MSLPHLLPYLLFVALGAAAPYLPDGMARYADAARAVGAALALVYFAHRGAYPELRPCASRMRGAVFAALAAGLAAGLIWVPLAELVPGLPGSRSGFDAADAGPVQWIARLLGSIAVVPFAEELLVRSYVPRFVDAGERPWTEHPVGRFSPLAVAVSLSLFTISHPEWLSALVVGALFTLLLSATGRLRDVVLAHAVANAVLAGIVIATGETHWW